MVDKNTKLSNKKGLTINKTGDKNHIDEGFLKEINHQNVAIEENTTKSTEDQPKIKLRINLNELEEKESLGSGASGEVKKANHKETGTTFALKIIPLRMDLKMKQLIEQEVRTLHNCKHENIIKCYASFFHEKSIKIVLEYMDKGTLADLLKKVKRVPENILGMITRQILKGLNYLHKAKIVHRDIKPSNFLINSKGIVKIADFGVCSQIKNSQESRTTLIGTYKYMSPERIKNENYSLPSDMWSFGLTIYECATGNFPYELEKKERDLQQDSNLIIWDLLYMLDKLPSPKLDENEFSKEFVEFVDLCMVKDPKLRPTPACLLNHPFSLQFENSSTKDIARYFNEINF